MKKYFYALCMATALGTVGCSDDEVINSGDVIDPSLKTSISFSASDEAGGGTSTKALTKADDAGFTAETQISARFVSQEGSTTNVRFTRTLLLAKQAETGKSYSEVDFNGEAYKRYWDDAFGRAAQISVYAIAVPGKKDVQNGGRKLELQLDDTGTKVNDVSNPNWKTGTENNTMEWTVSAANPTKDLIDNEDLCYSNNIQADATLGKNGRYVWDKTAKDYPAFRYNASEADPYPNFSDGMLSFKLDVAGETAGPGHFDKGHMIFKHALSRVTLNIKADKGFVPADYADGNVKEVHLNNVPYKGTFDVKEGKWTATTTTDKVYLVKEATVESGYNLKYTGQIVPEYVIKKDDQSVNMLQFTINDNVYYVTDKMVYAALDVSGNASLLDKDGDNIVMKPGKNYVLNITVNKTAISNVTATLVNWTEVTSDRFIAENAYITLNSFKPSSTDASDCTKFDLYRVLNTSDGITSPNNTTFQGTSQYMTGYVDGGGHTAHMLSTEPSPGGITPNDDGSWKTTWFFESNKTFYHFRTVWPGTQITMDLIDGDYFTMYSGPVNTTGTAISSAIDDNNNHDYHWGAVFKGDVSTSNLNYNKDDGFKSQLIGPIGPTKDAINIVEQHMMSKINVVLLTPVDDAGEYLPQSVTLFDGTKTGAEERVVSEVNLINFSGSANVLMGTGKIIPSTDRENKRTVTAPTYSKEYTSPGAATDYCAQKDYQFTGDPLKYYKTKEYTYCVVPQPLEDGADKVGITIQTPDDNLYYVVQNLSTITVQNVDGSNVKQDHAKDGKIERWYPGYSYTYYFVLTKTGIKAITCTIVDWKKVEGKKQDVTLES